MAAPLVRALGIIKFCAARVNGELGSLDKEIARAIMDAAKEVMDLKLLNNFPLSVWQTGQVRKVI